MENGHDVISSAPGSQNNLSLTPFPHECIFQDWGWVQEMYAFTLSVWEAGIKKVDLYPQIMAQPPWDKEMDQGPGKPFHIIHYTYGMDYTFEGKICPPYPTDTEGYANLTHIDIFGIS